MTEAPSVPNRAKIVTTRPSSKRANQPCSRLERPMTDLRKALLVLAIVALWGLVNLISLYQSVISGVTRVYNWLVSPFCPQGGAQVCSALAAIKELTKIMPWLIEQTFFALRVAAIPLLIALLIAPRTNASVARWWGRINLYTCGTLIILLMIAGITVGGIAGSLSQLLIMILQVAATIWFLWYFDRAQPGSET